MNIVDLIRGRRLANREQESRQIGWPQAVPAMGLDGLGSASYGPEAALTVLAPLGAASLAWIGWVMAPIVLLLATLYFSYRQTVVAYQTDGGAYTVAKTNIGPHAGLLAAAALMLDYILNVAVGISAGVGALTSAVPALHPHTLALCLAVLALVTFANLRGTAEAGLLFSLPTYVFIASFLGLIAVGVARTLMSAGHPAPVVAPALIGRPTEAVSLWLLMRAFAAGCTAMTGVEAVSNSIGAFKPPVSRRAHQTLTIVCATLGLLLSGVAVCARSFHIGAMDQTRSDYRSVAAQLAGAVAGHGPIFYVAMSSLLAVLALSANTSYVGFPRLCRTVAQDAYLPRPFALPDRRLVFSEGVAFLTLTAGGLLIVFDGITDRLIPLFAIGAFLTFAMSQMGMVAHWRRKGGEIKRLAINAFGAAITLVALVVIAMTKFAEGAWIVIFAIPATVFVMLAIRNYYDRLDASIAAASSTLQIAELDPPTVLVAIEDRSRMTDQALSFAMTLSPDVIAIHLLHLGGPEDDENAREIRRKWDAEVAEPLATRGLTPPRLVLLPAPRRQIHRPLLEFMDKLDADTPGRSVAVLIPELVLTNWWERLLHSRRSERLRRALLKHGGPRLNVIICPWRRQLPLDCHAKPSPPAH